MKKLYSIPTEEQLGKIAYILNTELSDIKKNNMSVVFELNDELLRQLDEDCFIKRNNEMTDEVFVPGSEVIIIADGIIFKFIKESDDKEEAKSNPK